MNLELQPSFSVQLRGYDREEVDEYAATLRRMLDEARRRLTELERALEEDHREEGAEPRTESAASSFRALSGRMAAMLELAEEEAAEIRLQAQQEAEALRAAAATDVEEVRTAREGAEQEAEAVVTAAREQAEDLLSRSRRHAEDQAEAIVAQAEDDARRILEEAERTGEVRLAEAEARRRELTATTQALEERHRRIVEDLARVRAALDADPAMLQPEELRLDARPGEPEQRPPYVRDDEVVG